MGILIDDLLSFSKLGKKELNKSNIDMQTMVNSIYHEITSAEQRKLIDLKIGNVEKCYGDPSLMRQVWSNLLSNAVKFTTKQEHPQISVASKKMTDKIIYYVHDNGAGFDKKYSEKLFKVFQRLHGSNEFEGTGVGLAIVQRIIQKHGGLVGADSNEETGTEFWFSIPVEN